MRFKLNFKTNDVMEQLIENMTEEEFDTAEEFASRWVKYGEYIRIVFDTEAGTAEVEEQ